MDRINLIPERRRLARQRRSRCRVWAISVVGYSAVVVALCSVYQDMGAQADATVLTAELVELDAQLLKVEQEQVQLKPELAEQRMVLAAGRSITDQPDWSNLLVYLADELLGDTVVLSGCTLGPVETTAETHELQDVSVMVTLKGHAKTTPAVSQFVLRLEQSGLFDRVSLTRTNREPFLNGQAIAFEARCLMDSSGGVPHE